MLLPSAVVQSAGCRASGRGTARIVAGAREEEHSGMQAQSTSLATAIYGLPTTWYFPWSARLTIGYLGACWNMGFGRHIWLRKRQAEKFDRWRMAGKLQEPLWIGEL